MKASKFILVVLTGICCNLAAAPAPCTAPGARQLDYWLGDWVVSSPDAPGKGHSKVYLSLDGCLVIESWGSDTTGHSGENALAYGTDDNSWLGLFVDNQGRVHALKGTVASGTAELEGPARDGNGHHTIKRVRILRLSDDHAQQVWEVSTDKGATWTTDYRMDYKRRNAVRSALTPR